MRLINNILERANVSRDTANSIVEEIIRQNAKDASQDAALANQAAAQAATDTAQDNALASQRAAQLIIDTNQDNALANQAVAQAATDAAQDAAAANQASVQVARDANQDLFISGLSTAVGANQTAISNNTTELGLHDARLRAHTIATVGGL